MSYWCQDVLDTIAARGAGSYVVVFPAYRPDLVEDLALALGCRFVDFRKERMMPLGTGAHRLALEAIGACADERANATGIVMQNAEALLAARSGEERQRWLSSFVETARGGIVILPLAVFGGDAPVHERVLRLSQDVLPPESLLRQLSSLKLQ
jgi:hypothetical protein